ncbi:MAG: DinB family protein [Candidatus Korobacteraceae bacterium]
MISRPNPTEYADFYANYISKVPNGDLLNFMDLQPAEFDGLINDLTDAQAIEPPAPGKWSVKQVLGHLCDTERVQSYRVLRFARGDQKELQGFEQDDYVAAANSNSRSTTELLAELKSVRRATLSLLESLTTADGERTGVASGKSISVRAMAYVIAGHTQHHLELMRKQFAGKA